AELNTYLNTLRLKYSQGAELDDTDMAALSAACGMAIQMNYSSDGSGASLYTTQEVMVDRFGYYAADMFGGLTHAGLVALQENMVNGLPAMLSFSPPDGWGGHAVVCDGYNTKGEYHLNFGWGTEYPQAMTEAWYLLPKSVLYSDWVCTEAIINILPAQPTVEVEPASLSFYAAPGQQSSMQVLRIKNNVANLDVDSVTCSDGFLIALAGQSYATEIDSFTIGQIRLGAYVNVVFKPSEAGSYSGILAIHYGDGSVKNVILEGMAYGSGTTVAAGKVSGTWSLAKSPYLVDGDIQVTAGGKLTIEPGVKVLFTGSFGLTVGQGAQLVAQGNDAQIIEFTAANTETGWGGLRFVDSGSANILSYCRISCAKKELGLNPGDDSTDASEADLYGGAIYCSASDLTIENCTITNNTGNTAGAIYCVESSPIISNSVIANNASVGGTSQCGGVYSYDPGLPEIRNCTIVNNFPGGLYAASSEGMIVTNTILWGNDRCQIVTEESAPTVTFCDVQGGYQGDGNFDSDPNFFDPTTGAGVEYDGGSADWNLKTTSPCINAGTLVDDLPDTDLVGAERIHSDVIDVGACESQSDLPLMSVTPSMTVDAGFVAVGDGEAVVVELSNTGSLDFEILDTSIPSGVFSIVTPIQNQTLTPGDTVEVKVQFQPTQEKAYVDTLLVRSTSSNGSTMKIALRGVGCTGTQVSGSVSGTWKKSKSPYIVAGDITVPKNKTLTIEPGVVVKFAGHFGLTVGYRATLKAVGTADDPIVFTAIDTDEGWFGIRFINSASDDQLQYCTLEYAMKPDATGGSFVDLYGGAVLCCGSRDYEPGSPTYTCPTIDSCRIANNRASVGGGIMCYYGGDAIITNNVIVDNAADMYGAGIAMYYVNCTVANNVIARNYASVGGGIMNWMGVPSITNNTIVGNKPSAMYLEVTTSDYWMVEPVSVENNILWQNEIHMAEGVLEEEYDIRYNDIQGGWTGTGNIAVDPLFADAENGDYHLKSQAGRWDPSTASWVLDDVTSPCIDAGSPSTDFSNEPAPNGLCVNMGAYGGTEYASKSPSDGSGL
ncbi:MAG: right-handed parallel beta-helix repeat-containing protein, partial [Solirubrobacterales bacterium]